VKKITFGVCLVIITIAFAGFGMAQDLSKGEAAFKADLEKAIPKDKIKTMADLYKVWLDVQAGKSKAILIDARTNPEFDAGHIEGSNLVTLGHVMTIPKRFPDPNAEYWVWCRTENRSTYLTAMMYKYGYKNVYLAKGGVVEWMKLGYPLVNRFMGRFKVEEYGHPYKEKGLIRDREFVDYKSYYKECIPQE
jgi:rhodanese-related sulfurtransferase